MEENKQLPPVPLTESQESLLSQLPSHKRAFVLVMKATFGNIAQSCDNIGITRRTYYNWLRDDVLFANIISEIDFKERRLDYVEHKLMKNIEDGKEASIIFFLKTQGRERGYDERNGAKTPGVDLDKPPSWFNDKELPDTSEYEDAIVISSTTNPISNEQQPPMQNPAQL